PAEKALAGKARRLTLCLCGGRHRCAFFFREHPRWKLLIGDDVTDLPSPVFFFPGLKVTILGVSCLTSRFVSKSNLVPSPVISKIVFDDDVNYDDEDFDPELSKEFL